MEGLSLNRIENEWGIKESNSILETAGKAMSLGFLIRKNDDLILTDTGKLMADGIASDLFFI